MGQTKEMQNLVNNLEKYRTANKISQAKFARMIDMSPSSYTKLLSGEINTISADTLKAIYITTGYLCYQLMEYFEDNYLKLGLVCKQLSDEECAYMIELVEKYKAFHAGQD